MNISQTSPTATSSKVNCQDTTIQVSCRGSLESNKSNVATKKGQVKQRNYKLNDVATLKKKMKNENRKNDFEISKEAKDYSNISILISLSS